MSAPIIVLKFGGTSVQDAAALERAARIVGEHGRAGGGEPVVVVSAMSKVTDALLAADEIGALDELLDRYRDAGRQLLPAEAARAYGREVDHARSALADALERLHGNGSDTVLRDEIASWGERLCAPLFAAALSARGLPAAHVDARLVVVTDEHHGRAAPLLDATERRAREVILPLVRERVIPVLGGYIGATPGGVTTTLGRGGSDYSAALLGAVLDAREIQIWTDVPGVLTADPRVVPGARTIPRLSYDEAAELAYFGAKVLHPRTIQPARDRKIPVRICDSRSPDGPATLVTAEADIWPETVKAIAHKEGITIVQITSARMLGAYGFLRALFDVFDRHHTAVDVVTTSEVSVSLSVDDSSALPAILDELRAFGHVDVESGRAIVCVIGEGLRRTPGIAARVFDAIADINVLLISQGASQVNLTFIVDQSHARTAVGRLHGALIGTGQPRDVPAASPTRDVVDLARCLIDIPSVSGDEAGIARFLSRFLGELGYTVDLTDAVPGRPNLLATTGEPPRVVLCTHLDTVPPFLGARDDGEFLSGRGACDAKGILAAQIVAAERLRAEGFQEIGLLFVVDEERGSLGARAANAHARARECRHLIVGEPTDNKLAVGCKGSLRVALQSRGTGGHSAYPEHGTSAIHDLLELLAEIRSASWPEDAFFGATTVNVGIVAGGTGSNVLAPEARAELHFRLVGDAVAVRGTLERIVNGRAAMEYLSVTPPVRLGSVPGFEQCVVGFTTDAAHLGHWGGGAALLLGPGSILEAHTDHERIGKRELAQGVDRYVRLVGAVTAGPALQVST